MDFADSPEHQAFRAEFRRWLAANLSPDLCVDDAANQRVAPDRETLEKRVRWQKTMNAAGWVGISWPQEYGGRGASFMQQVIFDEEYARARASILLGALQMTRLRSLTRRLRGEPPGPEGSVLKLFGSELGVRIADFASTLLGPYATVDAPTEAVADAARWYRRVLGARQYAIAGGTSEIQRNIIGERVLGLPKG